MSMKDKFLKRAEKAKRRALKVRKHPFVLPVLTFMGLFFAAIVTFVALNGTTLTPSDSRVVLLTVNGQQSVVPTRATTVGQLLEKSAISLGQGDLVEPDPSTPIVEDNFRVNVYRARTVAIYDGNKSYFTNSASPSPRTVVAQAGVMTYAEDYVDVVPIDSLTGTGFASEKIVIDRATPVNVSLYGVRVVLRTHAKSVADLLAEKNVKLSPKDTVKPALSTLLSKTQQILVTRAGTKIATRKETIAAPIQNIQDSSLSFGVSVVRQAGKPGERLVTYQINVVNGREVSRKVIQEVILEEPVNRIVASGDYVNIPSNKTSVLGAAGISPSDYKYADFIFSHESGWDAARTSANGCIGLGQNCPNGGGYFIKQACPQWEADPVCQARRFSGYAGRYGGWAGAYNYWISHHYW